MYEIKNERGKKSYFWQTFEFCAKWHNNVIFYSRKTRAIERILDSSESNLAKKVLDIDIDHFEPVDTAVAEL